MTIDPRADSPERLTAPAPLPYISRRALRRVKAPLPAPTICPNCKSTVELVSNAVVYRREFGEWPFVYRCTEPACNSYVGLHPNTDIPLGTLANEALRTARKSAKAVFQARMRAMRVDRSAMYEWLAARMNIPVAVCHFAWFDPAQCATAERICEEP